MRRSAKSIDDRFDLTPCSIAEIEHFHFALGKEMQIPRATTGGETGAPLAALLELRAALFVGTD